MNNFNNRYSRQTLFAPIGKSGQQKLLESRVLLVGCGALGAAQAESLARAGVGNLRIVDRDFVEFSNLQRQTLFSESDATERLPKVVAAKNRIGEINSETEVEAIIADVNHSNIEIYIKDCDLIIDGTDNFSTRYLINDACVKHGKNWIYGAAVSSYGVTMTIQPHETPCLRCIFAEMPNAGNAETCDTIGVIQPIISIVASVQVTETLKLLTGNRDKLHRSLMQFDVWENEWRKIKLGKPNADCKTCGQRVFEFLDAEQSEISTVLCGRNAVQIAPSKTVKIDLPKLSERLKNIGEVKQNEYLLRLTVDEYEVTIFRDARAIIRGTDDATVARSIYAKYIGI